MYTLENLKNRSLNEARNLYLQGFVSQDDFDAFVDEWTRMRRLIHTEEKEQS